MDSYRIRIIDNHHSRAQSIAQILKNHRPAMLSVNVVDSIRHQGPITKTTGADLFMIHLQNLKKDGYADGAFLETIQRLLPQALILLYSGGNIPQITRSGNAIIICQGHLTWRIRSANSARITAIPYPVIEASDLPLVPAIDHLLISRDELPFIQTIQSAPLSRHLPQDNFIVDLHLMFQLYLALLAEIRQENLFYRGSELEQLLGNIGWHAGICGDIKAGRDSSALAKDLYWHFARPSFWIQSLQFGQPAISDPSFNRFIGAIQQRWQSCFQQALPKVIAAALKAMMTLPTQRPLKAHTLSLMADAYREIAAKSAVNAPNGDSLAAIRQLRSEINHDWLKNRYLNRLNGYLIRIGQKNAAITMPGKPLNFERLSEFISNDFWSWQTHQPKLASLIRELPEQMSPKQLLLNRINGFPEKLLPALAEILDRLWRKRYNINLRSADINNACESARDRFNKISKQLPPGEFFSLEDLQKSAPEMLRFFDDCMALSRSLTHFPGEIKLL